MNFEAARIGPRRTLYPAKPRGCHVHVLVSPPSPTGHEFIFIPSGASLKIRRGPDFSKLSVKALAR